MIETFTLQQLTKSFIIRVIVYNIGAGYIIISRQNTIIIAIIILTTFLQTRAHKKGHFEYVHIKNEATIE